MCLDSPLTSNGTTDATSIQQVIDLLHADYLEREPDEEDILGAEGFG